MKCIRMSSLERIFASSLIVASVLVGASPAAASQKQQLAEGLMESQVGNALLGGDVKWLEETASALRQSKERMPDRSWRLQHFYSSLEFQCRAGEARVLSDHHAQLFAAWKQAYPQSADAPVAHAHCHFGVTRNIRGEGFANTVWPEDQKLHKAELMRVMAILQDSRSTASHNPLWHNLLARASKSLGVRYVEFTEAIGAAIRAEPDYDSHYRVGLYYLYPRWHGSHAQAERWMRRAAARTSKEQGQRLYAHLARVLSRDHEMFEVFHLFNVDWARLKVGMIDDLDRQPEPDFNAVMDYIAMSCFKRDHEQVHKVWAIWSKANLGTRPMHQEQPCGPNTSAQVAPQGGIPMMPPR